MNRFSSFVLISAVTLFAASANAGTFDVLPFPNPEYAGSGANAISRDGTTVAGFVTDSLGNSYPACWTGNQLVTLGTPGEWKYVSGNGNVLAGIIGNTPQISTNKVISNLAGPVSDGLVSNGVGAGISADGTIVFGQNATTSGGQLYRISTSQYGNLAFDFIGAFEQVRGTSQDGAVAVGDSLDSSNVDWPAYWDPAGAHLAPLLPGCPQGILSFASDGGNILYGAQLNSSTGGWHYTITADRKTVDLGAQPGTGAPMIISAANGGNTFVGVSDGAPIIWTSKEGYVQPATFFSEHGVSIGSYNIDSVNGVSADGHTFTGTCSPNNSIEAPIYAFVATVDSEGYPNLNKVVLASSSVVGGHTVSGTAILNEVTPFPVNLSIAAGDGPLAHAFVTVPAGQSQVRFTLNTEGASATTVLNLSGTLETPRTTNYLTLLPAAPSSLNFNASSIASGFTATAAVTLNGNAPMAGATATLTSSNTAAATVAPTVAVGKNVTSFSFPVATGFVTATSSSLISAKLNGATVTNTLTVTPLSFSIALQYPSLKGGGQVWCGVTFKQAAPANETLTVQFSPAGAASVVGPSVLRANGAYTSFALQTAKVNQSTPVTVTITLGSSSQQASFMITP